MKKSICALLLMLGTAMTIHAAIIKTGDVLNIQVQDQATFSGRFQVNEQGIINYPLMPDDPVANLSTTELANELTFRLARHIENPLVIITVVDKPEISVTVLGHVAQPGPVITYEGASVQEVIHAAGGPSDRADFQRVKIIHEGEQSDDGEFFDLKKFMRNGNIDGMPRLVANDVVILLSEERTTKVKVIGAVNKPGFFDLEENINVFELIYLAGGPSEKADLSRVRRFFKTDDKTLEEVLNVQAYIDEGKMDNIPIVNEGDVVIVYSKWFDWKTLLAILNNLLLFIVTIQSIRGALDN